MARFRLWSLDSWWYDDSWSVNDRCSLGIVELDSIERLDVLRFLRKRGYNGRASNYHIDMSYEGNIYIELANRRYEPILQFEEIAVVDNSGRTARFDATNEELLAMDPFSSGFCDSDCNECEGRCLACYYLTLEERAEMLRGLVECGLIEKRKLDGLNEYIERRRRMAL